MHYRVLLPDCGESLTPGEQPVGVHQPLPLHLHLASHLGAVAPDVVKQHLGLVSHVDLHGLPCALHPAGHVDGVPEETVPVQ